MGYSTQYIDVQVAKKRIKNLKMTVSASSVGLNVGRARALGAALTDHQPPRVILYYKNSQFAEYEEGTKNA